MTFTAAYPHANTDKQMQPRRNCHMWGHTYMDVWSLELFRKHACMGKRETSWPLLCVQVVTQAGHVCNASSMHVCIPTFHSGKQSVVRLELMQLFATPFPCTVTLSGRILYYFKLGTVLADESVMNC